MACCLTTPSHYLNQLNVNKDLWHSAETKYSRYHFEKKCSCKITSASPWGQRVKTLPNKYTVTTALSNGWTDIIWLSEVQVPHYISWESLRKLSCNTGLLLWSVDPFYWHGLTSTPAWINDYIDYKVRDDIYLSFPKLHHFCLGMVNIMSSHILLCFTCGPFYWHGLTLIPAWISNHTLSKVWEEITYPSLNFNGCTVEV